MNYSEAEKIIKRDVGWHWFWLLNPTLKLSDREITSVSPEQMLADMFDFVPSREYTNEKHDCDDQTFEELGHMTRKVRKGRGFAWSKKHAFCVFLTKDELWIYDRGSIMPYREAMQDDYFRGIYKLTGRIFKRDILVI